MKELDGRIEIRMRKDVLKDLEKIAKMMGVKSAAAGRAAIELFVASSKSNKDLIKTIGSEMMQRAEILYEDADWKKE